MLNPISAIQSYRPPFWLMPNGKELNEVPDIVEGDLVSFDSWDCQRDENKEVIAGYEGCGIIHYFTRAEFKNLETGKFEFCKCAVIVSANPDTDWHDFIKLEDIDPLSLTDYIELYEETYEELSPEARLQLRKDVAQKMQRYSRLYGNGGRVSNMQNGNNIVSLPNSTGGAQ